MEREHLIIIALILVALYMMNSSSSSDKVTAMGPLGRIRYNTDLPPTDMLGPPGPERIRTRREGFYGDGYESGVGPFNIRLGDKYFGGSQHVKNHIRHNNRNNMFKGMMGACDEGFRMESDCGPNAMPPC